MKKMNLFLFAGICMIILATSSNVGAVTVFEDDFSSGLTNWTTGTNPTLSGNASPTVGVANERVNYAQHYDYIQTIDTFGDDFEIQFEVERILRDSIAATIGAGSTEIQKITIARHLLSKKG